MKFNLDKITDWIYNIGNSNSNKNKNKDGLIMQIPDNGQGNIQNPMPQPKIIPSNMQPQNPPQGYRLPPNTQQQQQQSQQSQQQNIVPQGNPYDTFAPDRDEPKGKNKFGIDTGGLMPILVSVGVTIAVLLSGFLVPTLNNYRADVTRLETDMVAMRKTDTDTKDIANNAVTNANKFDARITAIEKTNSELATTIKGAVKQSDIDAATKSLDAKITSASSTTSSLDTKVDTLETKIKSLETQLASIKNGTNTNGGTVTTGLVSASILSNSNVINSFTTSNSTTAITYTIPFKVKINNGLNKEIRNLQLYTQVMGYSNYGTLPSNTVGISSSSGGVWSIYGNYGNSWYFTNSSTSTWSGSGLNIAANSSKIITLIFTFTVNPNQNPATVQFSQDIATISNGDYDVVN